MYSCSPWHISLTRCVARALVNQLSSGAYDAWRVQWDAATTLVGSGRDEALAAAYAALEADMTYVGATAIEDRLQAGVPSTIERLRTAGIRFWMLTGDKYSTALQIGRAANLLSGRVRARARAACRVVAVSACG